MKKLIKESFIGAIKKDEAITLQMSIRDIRSKYKGSRLGIVWSVLNPLAMLIIYTLVFSQIFQARWGSEDLEGNQTMIYAVNLFAGLSVLNIFSEVMIRSPELITQNPNYEEKSSFSSCIRRNGNYIIINRWYY